MWYNPLSSSRAAFAANTTPHCGDPQMIRTFGLALAFALVPLSFAAADPCGMVPPIYIQGPSAITRVGDQITYVFYKDGYETFVIRPGFNGKVEEFGMLVP